MRVAQLYILSNITRISRRFFMELAQKNKKNANPPCKRVCVQYRLWDSNPHSFELDFESSASTNSAKPALRSGVQRLKQSRRGKSRQKPEYTARMPQKKRRCHAQSRQRREIGFRTAIRPSCRTPRGGRGPPSARPERCSRRCGWRCRYRRQYRGWRPPCSGPGASRRGRGSPCPAQWYR